MLDLLSFPECSSSRSCSLLPVFLSSSSLLLLLFTPSSYSVSASGIIIYNLQFYIINFFTNNDSLPKKKRPF